MSLMETLYVKYHKLTKDAYKIFAPTTTKHQKIAGINVCKTLLVSTRQIKEKQLFYIGLLRISPLTV